MRFQFSLVVALAWLVATEGSSAPLKCSISDEEEIDPALQEMTFDLGDGEETFLAYVQPDVTSFYRDQEPPSTEAVVPMFKGLAEKFINLSNRTLNLYWEPHAGADASLMRPMPPFFGSGSASFPSHRFFFADPKEPEKKLILFIVKDYPENIYAYDPYEVPNNKAKTEALLNELNPEHREKYNLMKRTLRFNEHYKKITGRSYLANFPRKSPNHFMWRADYFGQTHWVETRETHFASHPPEKLSSKRITEKGKNRKLGDNDPRLLAEYRVDEPIMNMTLKVLSCAPRVFEIPNFLSPTEIEHILYLASGEELHLSSTGVGNKPDKLTKADLDARRTRTSRNSWVERERSPIIDTIYRRAADLMRIDEALLRERGDGEHPEYPTSRTISESLQLVHYDHKQEYTAHHDFGYQSVDSPVQSHRFATLLLYLNEGMVGGQTTFPRWVNAESFEELQVTPEIGKAVLFYSQLPDGNMDDFSQHAAKKVWEGEKWLINLWTWSPTYDRM